MKFSFHKLITIITVVVGVLTLASCKVSPCDKQLCKNANYVESGKNCVCQCPDGLEGQNCDVSSTDKFVRNSVSVNEHWKNSNENHNYYTSVYTYGGSGLNFSSMPYNSQYSGFTATVNNSTEVQISNSSVEYYNGGNYYYYRYNGSGKLENNTLKISGTFVDMYNGSFVDSVFFTLSY